jgi:hypothetical protein
MTRSFSRRTVRPSHPRATVLSGRPHPVFRAATRHLGTVGAAQWLRRHLEMRRSHDGPPCRPARTWPGQSHASAYSAPLAVRGARVCEGVGDEPLDLAALQRLCMQRAAWHQSSKWHATRHTSRCRRRAEQPAASRCRRRAARAECAQPLRWGEPSESADARPVSQVPVQM